MLHKSGTSREIKTKNNYRLHGERPEERNAGHGQRDKEVKKNKPKWTPALLFKHKRKYLRGQKFRLVKV